MPVQIDVLFFDAASGHRSCAEALQHGLLQEHPDWDVRAVNLVDILARRPHLVRRPIAWGIHYFNAQMRRESYYGNLTLFSISILWSRLIQRWPYIVRGLSEFWTLEGRRPDAVISVTPMFNPLVYAAARTVNPDVQCVTIPVDYSEPCSGYWFTPDHRQTYLIGAPDLEQTALDLDVLPEDVRMMSGMPVDPRFYAPPTQDRRELLTSLDLNPDLPTGVISFGGQGTVHVLQSMQSIAEAKIPVNVICLCGRNAPLKAAVERMSSPFPKVALAYRPSPPVDILHAADFLIGKPGTMTLTEALITRTPFIFINSAGLHCIQGQNEAWVESRGLGLGVKSPCDVSRAVREVISNGSFLAATDRERHRGIFDAVYEISQLLQRRPRYRDAATPVVAPVEQSQMA